MRRTFDPRYPEDALELKSGPQMWVVTSLEIYVDYDDDIYTLLVHPFYAAHDLPGDYTDGYLYPPFHAVQMQDVSQWGPADLSEWMTLTDEFIRSHALHSQNRFDQLFNLYGWGPMNHSYRSTTWEKKESPVTGHGTHLYRIDRYICQPRAETFIRNITDPHFMKGHIFVPIIVNSARNFLALSQDDLVRGRRIVRNYVDAVSGEPELRHINHVARETTRGDWITHHCGFLVMIDIAGFGQLGEYFKSSTGNPWDNGESIATRFRNSVAEIFEAVLHVSDPIQSYFTGDGMIASLPDRSDATTDERRSALAHFIEAYRSCVRYLEFLNEVVPETIRVGTRLVIHYGEYEFGRVGGPSSNASNFAGDSIVELARSEAALSEFSKSEESTVGRHCVALSDAAGEALDELEFPVDGIADDLSRFVCDVKERTVSLSVGTLKFDKSDA